MVKIYTRSTCAPCKMLKTWFNKKNIKFEELDVDNPATAGELFRLTGMQIVPVTVVDDQVIPGPNIGLISSALGDII